MISLLSFNPHKPSPPYLDSPRSLEACSRQGISPEELLIKPKSYFLSLLGPKAPKAIIQLHIESYERRRAEKLSLALEERTRIVREEEAAKARKTAVGRESEGKNQFLIEHEQRKIESLKKKQELEMMNLKEKQRVLEEIRIRNEEKQRILGQKDEYYKKIVEENHKEEEERRKKEEKRKMALESAKELSQKKMEKRYAEQQHRKFSEFLAKEKQRKQEAKIRDLEARKKQEKARIQAEQMLSQQREMVELRRQEMAIRDAERQFALESKRKQMRLKSAKIQSEKTEKLRKAQENLQLLLEKQKSKYEKRQQITEEKLREFEQMREHKKEENRKKAEEKQKLIEKTISQSREIELRRKQEYLRSMKKVEIRKEELSKIAKLQHNQRIADEIQKEKQRKQVRKRMEMLESQRKSDVFQKLQETAMQVADVQARHQWELRIMKEKHILKRQEREDEVRRVAKMKEYRRKQIQERMKSEDEKTKKVMEEKRKLMEARGELRREMDAQKERLLHEFSSSRRSTSRISTAKPSLTTQSLTSLSLKRPSTFQSRQDDRLPAALSTRTEFSSKPVQPDTMRTDLAAFKRKKNAIMKEEIEFELRKEEERDRMLSLEQDSAAREKLEKVFGMERMKASRRIEELAEWFDREAEKARGRVV